MSKIRFTVGFLVCAALLMPMSAGAMVRLDENFPGDHPMLMSPDVLDAFVKVIDQVRKVVDSMKRSEPPLGVVVVRLEETRFPEALARILIEVGGACLAATVAERLADECPEFSLGM